MDHTVIDAHVHFWDPRVLRYPWLDAYPSLRRRYGPVEYAAAIGDMPVPAVVLVEGNCVPAQSLAEVRHFERIAEEAAVVVAGVVAFADVTDPSALPGVLDSLSASRLVKGIRHNIQGEAPGFCVQPAFVTGVRDIGRRGLTFDLCATHDQLPDVIELVRQCPDTRFVLDHCGKPAIRERALDTWARNLGLLAVHDNVSCKLSGLLTEASPSQRGGAALMPFAERVVESFSPARLIYGSDWPVVTLAGAYADWYAFTRQVTAAWSVDEQSAFYAGNATRVYGLAAPLARRPEAPIRA